MDVCRQRTVAVLGLMGLVSLLNWGFILISIYTFMTNHGPYVGQTIQRPQVRWNQHLRSGRNGTNHRILHSNLPACLLNPYEAYHIGAARSFNPGSLQNRTRGNDLASYQAGRSGMSQRDFAFGGVNRHGGYGLLGQAHELTQLRQRTNNLFRALGSNRRV